MAPPQPLQDQLSSLLQTRHHLPVHPRWLSEFLSTRGPNPPPMPALLSTAHFRILTSDITTSLRPTNSAEVLPADISDITVKERRLAGPVITQVLDVIDVGSSKWSQVEAIERVERGEEVRGREVIRTVDDGNDEDAVSAAPAPAARATTTSNTRSTATATSLGPHKLLLQDAKGTKVLAFEVVKVPGIGVSTAASASASVSAQQQQQGSNRSMVEDPGMAIGCKILLKPGTVVRRGMVMLKPEDCVVIGGKVDAWDRKWKEERKKNLTMLLNRENGIVG
ncbi:hypothetical protein HRR83_007092 [Exophiala dermatitidis]|uniref:RecQ-mediated genome instability protein 1 n=2 Tax=Exophiala dermatitidis TaxID=5970 RepID=H6C4V7_EXODN|nr:uncharacterized protein HMPREF1120_06544 [Exophiala dermatitidis NIH/UT8656]KAJ4511053.1 hypothetical protein HRR73_006384 [Exophiala dermatitidis]EHY58534.1 hypothetical protein HMPREF1120_06544 [Exophiala dermatitidis NIH/UT8656]KAJ4512012.1 hypothetical protein HRR74_006748 [Exophiala dermatitidis]KAJ4534878.1 hypothetical protein HRR76_006784 [Exophiala dermatitidis]KAJ4550774.1 hypothetical protein HRR77_003133 [Exophiala dermatitidis]